MKKSLRTQAGTLAVSALVLGSFTAAKAQFHISESFQNSTANGSIILGGAPTAFLTASNGTDPEGSGWLRLTDKTGNQKGFAYVNEAFPSTQGVLVDFEYKTWGGNGADGICVFLFDADSSGSHFRLGGYGGSLGYAPNTTSGTPAPLGLSGGYIGIGLDEFGNFANPTEGRIGGPGSLPNAVVLRGPTTNDPATTNKYLASYQLTAGTNNNNGIWYRTSTTTRPSDNTFYRRVQISITPDNGEYQITVSMKKSLDGSFQQLISYTTATPPPANLMLGFASSTGGSDNYHEIRKLDVTTPGGVSLSNAVSEPVAGIGTQLVYTINANNGTTAPAGHLALNDTLYDGNGNPIPASQVRIDSIVFKNNGNADNAVTTSSGTTNPFTDSLNLAAATAGGGTTGTFLVYATVLEKPAGGIITNKAYLDPANSGITDDNLANNTASSTTRIIETDLSVTETHDGDFHAGDQSKNLTIHVTNNGPDATGTATTVKDTLPAGLTYAGTTGDQGNGWTISVDGNIVTAVYNGSSVPSGGNFTDLNIPVNVDNGTDGQTVTNTVGVSNITDNNLSNNNTQENIDILPPIATPVTLSSFTGSRVDHANVLSWTTATEINNKGFELQRSTDGGKTWTDVTFKNGYGTSSNPHSYTYSDAEGAAYAVALYRLQQVNLDGTSVIEKDIVTIEGSANAAISLYPNPAASDLNIAGLQVNNGSVNIIAAGGARVKTVSISGQRIVTIPVNDLPGSYYFVQVISNGKVVYKGKFIKK